MKVMAQNLRRAFLASGDVRKCLTMWRALRTGIFIGVFIGVSACAALERDCTAPAQAHSVRC
jgi:hypothetical protein